MSIASLFDPGILRSALLPSLQLHTSLAIPTYVLGRALNHVESKDLLWGSSMVLNAWWVTVGRRMYYNNASLSLALGEIGRPGRLLLTGVTLWGGRLFYRVLTRAIERGEDDPRYDNQKDSSSWNLAPVTTFLPEILFQAFITLSFTLPYNVPSAPIVTVRSDWAGYLESLAVGLWTTGFVMEVVADAQLAYHKASGGRGLCRERVWSIVRHPNYLGDLLTHIAYPILLIPSSLFNPYTLLGPLANWLFLRRVGGDGENEQSQRDRYANDPEKMLDLVESKEEKNAFWPSLRELGNVWVWAVVGAGAAAGIAEGVYRGRL